MKTIVFSDSHLDAKFNKNKFLFLKDLISSADKVIINGDFWDSYFCSFEDFLTSEWKELFPLLKSKEAVYLFGNHDRKTDIDDRCLVFCNKYGYEFEMGWKGKTLHIEHGNRFYQTFTEKTPWLRNNRTLLTLISYPFNLVEFFNAHYFKNIMTKKTDAEMQEAIFNKEKNKNFKLNTIYICGHTHYPQVNFNKGYINDGYIQYGLAHYLIIDEGNIELVKTKY